MECSHLAPEPASRPLAGRRPQPPATPRHQPRHASPHSQHPPAGSPRKTRRGGATAIRSDMRCDPMPRPGADTGPGQWLSHTHDRSVGQAALPGHGRVPGMWSLHVSWRKWNRPDAGSQPIAARIRRRRQLRTPIGGPQLYAVEGRRWGPPSGGRNQADATLKPPVRVTRDQAGRGVPLCSHSARSPAGRVCGARMSPFVRAPA